MTHCMQCPVSAVLKPTARNQTPKSAPPDCSQRSGGCFTFTSAKGSRICFHLCLSVCLSAKLRKESSNVTENATWCSCLVDVG